MIETLTKEKLKNYGFNEHQIECLCSSNEYCTYLANNQGFFYASNKEMKIYSGKEGKAKHFEKSIVPHPSKEEKTKFDSIEELFQQLLILGIIKIDKENFATNRILELNLFTLRFNNWLIENNYYTFGNEEQYKECLTKERWIEFNEHFEKEKIIENSHFEKVKSSWTPKSNVVKWYENGKKVKSDWDFMTDSGIIKGMKERFNVDINPTHDFNMLKRHRLKQYETYLSEIKNERELNHQDTTPFEENYFYYGWLNHELKAISNWLSDTYPNGEKKRIRPSESEQFELLKYRNFIDQEILKLQKIDEEIPDESEPSRTKEIIEDHLRTTKEFAFNSDKDYNTFLGLLINFFTYKPFKLPSNKIKLKRGCKTRFSPIFNSIHLELSEKKLKGDLEYFKIIKVLNHFSELSDDQIYKLITR